MQKISNVLENKKEQMKKDTTVNSYTVDSRKRFQSTVNSKEEESREKTLEEEMQEVINKHNVPTEGKAQYLAELLNDTKSFRYYEILVKEHKPEFLIERAHYVKEMDLQGKLHTHNRAVYFQGILRKLGMRTSFKKKT